MTGVYERGKSPAQWYLDCDGSITTHEDPRLVPWGRSLGIDDFFAVAKRLREDPEYRREKWERAGMLELFPDGNVDQTGTEFSVIACAYGANKEGTLGYARQDTEGLVREGFGNFLERYPGSVCIVTAGGRGWVGETLRAAIPNCPDFVLMATEHKTNGNGEYTKIVAPNGHDSKAPRVASHANGRPIIVVGNSVSDNGMMDLARDRSPHGFAIGVTGEPNSDVYVPASADWRAVEALGSAFMVARCGGKRYPISSRHLGEAVPRTVLGGEVLREALATESGRVTASVPSGRKI